MTVKTAETKVVEGREIPPAGTWLIDPSHSDIQFTARHMMISKARGRFRTFSGTIHIDEVPERSSVAATIEAASIDTGDDDRDRHLRSPDFLDVERFPEISYRSTSVRPGTGDRWAVTENGRHLLDCATSNEGETLIRVVKHYGFDQLCHLGPTQKLGVSFLTKVK